MFKKSQAVATASAAAGLPASAVGRLRGDTDGTHVFTSDLSVSEFVLLKQMGMQALGLVLGSTVYHVGIQYGNLFANQELTYLSEALYHARELALERMKAEAAMLEADGILGVRLQVRLHDWATDALEIVAVGTAVRAPQDERAAKGQPYSSNFSVQEFYKTYQAGYLPANIVMGSCVYHVARQNLIQTIGQFGRNTELSNYTQAIYEARELAMSRMQSEAESHGAEGIIGVEIVEQNHRWQSHVIEFFAIGTSIVPRPETGEMRDMQPIFAIGLND